MIIGVLLNRTCSQRAVISTNPKCYVMTHRPNHTYEVCPKSNETGVIKIVLKSIEIYQSQISSKYPPSTLKHLCIRLFQDSIHSWKTFSGIFLSSVVAAILMESMSEKWVLFRTDLILWKRKKSQGARSGE